MFKKFVESGYKDDGAVSEWQASLDSLEPDAKTQGAKFFERCEELEGMTATYAFYRGLSLVSHADGMVVDLYCRKMDEADPLGVALTSIPDEWAPQTLLGMTLTYLLLAGMAWDRMDKSHPNRTRLKEIAAEMGFALTWRQSDVGFVRQGKWEKARRERQRALS